MQRIEAHKNGRFLVKEDGSPFFWLADTAWLLIHIQNEEEVDRYLKDRAAKGFNVIQAVVGPPGSELHQEGVYEETRFIDNDPTRPNEAYFEKQVDYVVDRAEAEGLYLCLVPTWGWAVVQPEYRYFDETNARVYGEFIGARYAERAHILWCIGGDQKAVIDDENCSEREKDWKGDYRPVWRALAEGIAKGVTGEDLAWDKPDPAWQKLFMTWHPPGGGNMTSSAWFHKDAWLSMNMIQTSHGHYDNATSYRSITRDYELTPIKPTLDGESPYEDHPVGWKPDRGRYSDWDVRKAAYWSVFAGACGHTYGNHNVWYFYKPGREPWVNAAQHCYWYDALNQPGARQMIHLRRLVESRPYLLRIPDQSVLACEAGDGARRLQATRGADGSYIMVYTPESDLTLRVHLGRIAATTARAWWFNPRNGSAAKIGEFQAEGVGKFKPPRYGPDWVLVLDDAGAGFPEPGWV